MRRTNWKTVSTLITMVVVAGCQEGSVSAPQASTSSAAAMALAPAGRPSLALSGSNGGSGDFTVGPNGGVYYTGTHAVVFPAGSICDPATSSYGAGTWDAPCTPLTSAIRIRAVVRNTTSGRSSVDFSPALRFVPSSNPSSWVWMYMYTPDARGYAGDLSKFNVGYITTLGASPIDESLTDASLRTYVDTRSGISARRIKHFSGYTVVGHHPCTVGVDPDCVDDGLGERQ